MYDSNSNFNVDRISIEVKNIEEKNMEEDTSETQRDMVNTFKNIFIHFQIHISSAEE